MVHEAEEYRVYTDGLGTTEETIALFAKVSQGLRFEGDEKITGLDFFNRFTVKSGQNLDEIYQAYLDYKGEKEVLEPREPIKEPKIEECKKTLIPKGEKKEISRPKEIAQKKPFSDLVLSELDDSKTQ